MERLSLQLGCAVVFMVCASTAQSQTKASDTPQSPETSVITHDSIKPIRFDCAKRDVPTARSPGAVGLDPEILLMTATKGKRFPYEATASLGWLDTMLISYGNTVPLTTLTGPARVAALRVALLVRNDYTIAAQMAYGLSSRIAAIPEPQATYVGNLVMNLTEPAHDMPEIDVSNALIERANQILVGASVNPTAGKAITRSSAGAVSAAMLPYARWAVRGYAYDDDVAIDAALAGVCMSSPTAADLRTLEAAIKVARYDPTRDYGHSPSH